MKTSAVAVLAIVCLLAVSAYAQSGREIKPEIHHQFREPEKRPPAIVSTVFSGLVVAPLLFLFVGLAKLKVTLGYFPFNSFPKLVTALLFQGCIIAIYLLYTFFWLQFNLVQTLTGLAVLAVPTIFIGNKALCDVATVKSAKAAKSE
eukprot:GILI01003425.1.p1 GENE.GILI01003425.1~~GILI01003425.1.p1  ORF type:complete len:147 (+),score=47.53 GILI01003425.1:58-498(+)